MKKVILIAGATGNLGTRIVNTLVSKDVEVRIIVRKTSDETIVNNIRKLGVKVFVVNNWTVEELVESCKDVTCVVSCLAGLRNVIIDAQKVLLDAAIAANVPRFIPSDYSLDFTKLKDGENRNFDLRREFHLYLDKAPIAATSIFNGAFTDMLTGQMPVLLFNQNLVLYWGNSNTRWAFTTMDNTAEYTAKVAGDENSPRYLTIAGDQITPKEIRAVANEVFHKKFKLFRPGGQGLLGAIIKITKKFQKGENELYPAWQGMQYMHNMIDERSKIDKLDNNRFPEIKWQTAKDVLTKFKNDTDKLNNS
jgi:nucleoside-diphosphate-sugar epimerase